MALLGGGVGLAVAWLLVSGGSFNSAFLPIFVLQGRDVMIGVALSSVLLGALAGCLPAMAAMRLQITDALRSGGRGDVFRWMGQTIAVTSLGIRTIPQPARFSIVAVIGIAGVVIVLIAVLSIAEGFRAAMTVAGSSERALVMRSGARLRVDQRHHRRRGGCHHAGTGHLSREAMCRSPRLTSSSSSI